MMHVKHPGMPYLYCVSPMPSPAMQCGVCVCVCVCVVCVCACVCVDEDHMNQVEAAKLRVSERKVTPSYPSIPLLQCHPLTILINSE